MKIVFPNGHIEDYPEDLAQIYLKRGAVKPYKEVKAEVKQEVKEEVKEVKQEPNIQPKGKK
jgi:hypothetical protein